MEQLESVPLGRACENSAILFLDEENRVVTAPDVQAEICVGGVGVGLGYWNNPEKTREVFIQNPARPQYRDIVYKTGDLGYVSSRDGLIYFNGRKDHQIKHLGYRIELGEIETALLGAAQAGSYGDRRANGVDNAGRADLVIGTFEEARTHTARLG